MLSTAYFRRPTKGETFGMLELYDSRTNRCLRRHLPHRSDALTTTTPNGHLDWSFSSGKGNQITNSSLNVDAHIKIDMLLGTLSGNMHHASSQATSSTSHVICANLVKQCPEVSFNVDTLDPAAIIDILEECQAATHIVCIQANTGAVKIQAEITESEHSNVEEYGGNLEADIRTFMVRGRASLDISESKMSILQNIRVTVVGTLPNLGCNCLPHTLEGVPDFVSRLNEYIGDGVMTEVELMPVSALPGLSRLGRLVRVISDNALEEVEQRMLLYANIQEPLSSMERRCHVVFARFPHLGSWLQNFRTPLASNRQGLVNRLMEIIPMIRSGERHENDIASVCHEFSCAPFTGTDLFWWVQHFKTQVDSLYHWYSIAADECSSECDPEGECFTSRSNRSSVLVLNVQIPQSDSLICSLKSGSPWHVTDNIQISNIDSQFQKFIDAVKYCPGVSEFAVISSPGSGDAIHCTLKIWRNGNEDDFTWDNDMTPRADGSLYHIRNTHSADNFDVLKGCELYLSVHSESYDCRCGSSNWVHARPRDCFTTRPTLDMESRWRFIPVPNAENTYEIVVKIHGDDHYLSVHSEAMDKREVCDGETRTYFVHIRQRDSWVTGESAPLSQWKLERDMRSRKFHVYMHPSANSNKRMYLSVHDERVWNDLRQHDSLWVHVRPKDSCATGYMKNGSLWEITRHDQYGLF